jgi:hypothetical protein
LDQPAVRWPFGDANGAGQQSRTPVAALPPAMKTRLELTICRSRRHFHSPFPLAISTHHFHRRRVLAAPHGAVASSVVVQRALRRLHLGRVAAPGVQRGLLIVDRAPE